MNTKDKLKDLLMEYFSIGDSYSYNLTRVKEAFAVGTVSLEDFVEFDEEFIDDIVNYLLKHNVSVDTQKEVVMDKIYKTVEQECSGCGKHFYLKYCSDGTYEYIGEVCDCLASFHPVNGEPSIQEWVEIIK